MGSVERLTDVTGPWWYRSYARATRYACGGGMMQCFRMSVRVTRSALSTRVPGDCQREVVIGRSSVVSTVTLEASVLCDLCSLCMLPVADTPVGLGALAYRPEAS